MLSYALKKESPPKKKTTLSREAKRETISVREISIKNFKEESTPETHESVLTKKSCVFVPFFDAKKISEKLGTTKILRRITTYQDGNTRTETTCFFKTDEEENEYQLTQIIDTLKHWNCCIHTSDRKRYASPERGICITCKEFFQEIDVSE